MREKPSEFCVDDEELLFLQALPVNSMIRNGTDDAPIYFLKIASGEWVSCTSDGAPYIGESMWLGPFRSDHIHAGIRYVGEINDN